MAEMQHAAETSVLRTESQRDLDLLVRIASGDQHALASLYDRHSKLVYSIASKICNDPALAEEVLEDLFMSVWRMPMDFMEGSGSLVGRLAMMSRKLALQTNEKRLPVASPREPALERSSAFVTHDQVSHMLRKQSHDSVQMLPDEDRMLLDLAFFGGRTSSQIAAETGYSLETVAGRIKHALSVLRLTAAEVLYASEDTGLEVSDLDSEVEFNARSLHPRDVRAQMEGLRRLTSSFLQSPDMILQKLVDSAVDLCGADSAGISLEMEEKSEASFYHWVATAGQYKGFTDAILPQFPSACGICLERGKPQLFRLRQRFFDIMGIEAPLVTDGILLPWQVEGTRGTIFIMAHGRTAAFDEDDGQMMRVLADFAAMAVRHHRQQEQLLQRAKVTAAAEMANQLAHKINNPLQSLVQLAYLAAEGQSGKSAETLGKDFSVDLKRLSVIVAESLTPATAIRDPGKTIS